MHTYTHRFRKKKQGKITKPSRFEQYRSWTSGVEKRKWRKENAFNHPGQAGANETEDFQYIFIVFFLYTFIRLNGARCERDCFYGLQRVGWDCFLMTAKGGKSTNVKGDDSLEWYNFGIFINRQIHNVVYLINIWNKEE